MQLPKISLSFLDNFICSMGDGMIEGMLGPHMIEKGNSTQTAVGQTFLIYALAYTLASPIAGYVSLVAVLTLLILFCCKHIIILDACTKTLYILP